MTFLTYLHLSLMSRLRKELLNSHICFSFIGYHMLSWLKNMKKIQPHPDVWWEQVIMIDLRGRYTKLNSWSLRTSYLSCGIWNCINKLPETLHQNLLVYLALWVALLPIFKVKLSSLKKVLTSWVLFLETTIVLRSATEVLSILQHRILKKTGNQRLRFIKLIVRTAPSRTPETKLVIFFYCEGTVVKNSMSASTIGSQWRDSG